VKIQIGVSMVTSFFMGGGVEILCIIDFITFKGKIIVKGKVVPVLN
jgi:hypothetical protein